jgi:hypothetical protein
MAVSCGSPASCKAGWLRRRPPRAPRNRSWRRCHTGATDAGQKQAGLKRSKAAHGNSDGVVRKQSQYIGVSWFEQTSKWQARISTDSKVRSLGYYHGEEDAARAYDTEALTTRGPNAVTNFAASEYSGSSAAGYKVKALGQRAPKAAPPQAPGAQQPQQQPQQPQQRPSKPLRGGDAPAAAPAAAAAQQPAWPHPAQHPAQGFDYNQPPSLAARPAAAPPALPLPAPAPRKRRPGLSALVQQEAVKAVTRHSKYIGVTWDKHTLRWKAQVWTGNTNKTMGYYDEELEAAVAYDRGALQLKGAAAKLNFPNTSSAAPAAAFTASAASAAAAAAPPQQQQNQAAMPQGQQPRQAPRRQQEAQLPEQQASRAQQQQAQQQRRPQPPSGRAAGAAPAASQPRAAREAAMSDEQEAVAALMEMEASAAPRKPQPGARRPQPPLPAWARTTAGAPRLRSARARAGAERLRALAARFGQGPRRGAAAAAVPSAAAAAVAAAAVQPGAPAYGAYAQGAYGGAAFASPAAAPHPGYYHHAPGLLALGHPVPPRPHSAPGAFDPYGPPLASSFSPQQQQHQPPFHGLLAPPHAGRPYSPHRPASAAARISSAEAEAAEVLGQLGQLGSRPRAAVKQEREQEQGAGRGRWPREAARPATSAVSDDVAAGAADQAAGSRATSAPAAAKQHLPQPLPAGGAGRRLVPDLNATPPPSEPAAYPRHRKPAPAALLPGPFLLQQQRQQLEQQQGAYATPRQAAAAAPGPPWPSPGGGLYEPTPHPYNAFGLHSLDPRSGQAMAQQQQQQQQQQQPYVALGVPYLPHLAPPYHPPCPPGPGHLLAAGWVGAAAAWHDPAALATLQQQQEGQGHGHGQGLLWDAGGMPRQLLQGSGSTTPPKPGPAHPPGTAPPGAPLPTAPGSHQQQQDTQQQQQQGQGQGGRGGGWDGDEPPGGSSGKRPRRGSGGGAGAASPRRAALLEPSTSHGSAAAALAAAAASPPGSPAAGGGGGPSQRKRRRYKKAAAGEAPRADGRRLNMQSTSGRGPGNGRPKSSRFIGVTWHKNGTKWQAQIRVQGTIRSLGYFATEEAAAHAFDAAARQYRGAAARVNFPLEPEPEPEPELKQEGGGSEPGPGPEGSPGPGAPLAEQQQQQQQQQQEQE